MRLDRWQNCYSAIRRAATIAPAPLPGRLLLGGGFRDKSGSRPPTGSLSTELIKLHLLAAAAMLAAAGFTAGLTHFWQWTPQPTLASAMQAPFLAAIGLTGAWGLLVWASTLNADRQRLPCLLTLVGALLLAAGGIHALLNDPWTASMMLNEQTTPAVIWLLTGWTAVHAMLGALMLTYCAARCMVGRLQSAHDAYMYNSVLYWTFLLFTVWITVAVLMAYLAFV